MARVQSPRLPLKAAPYEAAQAEWRLCVGSTKSILLWLQERVMMRECVNNALKMRKGSEIVEAVLALAFERTGLAPLKTLAVVFLTLALRTTTAALLCKRYRVALREVPFLEDVETASARTIKGADLPLGEALAIPGVALRLGAFALDHFGGGVLGLQLEQIVEPVVACMHPCLHTAIEFRSSSTQVAELQYIEQGFISTLCPSAFLRMRLRGLSAAGAHGPRCLFSARDSFLPKSVAKCIKKEFKGVTYRLPCLHAQTGTARLLSQHSRTYLFIRAQNPPFKLKTSNHRKHTHLHNARHPPPLALFKENASLYQWDRFVPPFLKNVDSWQVSAHSQRNVMEDPDSIEILLLGRGGPF